jgi:hypothetical protein
MNVSNARIIWAAAGKCSAEGKCAKECDLLNSPAKLLDVESIKEWM